MKGIIKDFVVRGRRFVIVQDKAGYFLAVEDKYLDKYGRLTETLNGLQLHASQCLKTCLQGVRDAVEIDYLLSQGATKAQAFSAVSGVPLEIAETLF